MSKGKVNQCYSRDCRYNKHDMCQRDSGIIVKEDGTCAYHITEAKWKTHVLKD